MKTLVFSDLHANKKALNDIARIINKVDRSVFCGDILGYGSDIDYCVDFILNNVDFVVLGNHDRMAVTDEDIADEHPVVKESIGLTRKKISAEHRRRISLLLKEIWHEDIYVTHSLDNGYLRTEADFMKIYEKMLPETKYAFFGHTHEQVLYKKGGKVIINPGSITKGRRGFPRSYILIDNEDIQFINLPKIL